MAKETDRKRADGAAVRRVLQDYARLYRKHPWWSLLAFLCPAVGTVCISYLPPLAVSRLVDRFVAAGRVSLDGTLPYLLAFAGTWALGEVLWRVGFHFLIRLEGEGMAELSKRAFADLLGRDYGFYANAFMGTLTKRALAYARNFEDFTDIVTFNILGSVLPVAFVTVVLWGYSPWLPLVLLAFLAGGTALALPVVKRRAKLTSLRHAASSRMVGRLSDSLGNVLAVKSHAQEEAEAKGYAEHVDEFAERFRAAGDYQNLRYDTVMAPLYVLANAVGLAAAVFFAATLPLPVGSIVLVFSYYSQATRILWDVSRTYRRFESSVTEAAEFSQMFLEPPKVRDAAGARPLRVTGGAIRFEGVSFGYGEGAHVLRGFDLSVAAGERVGLVGPSGGGKSTVTKLLLRFADPQEGRVLIDGQDTAGVTQASLRDAVSYVPQEPLLFHRTILENISYGRPDATEEEVLAAAHLARADEFIDRLPQGYATPVGERGVRLSGGQKQRLAIARAVLRDAPIVVLDEATSALDSESERYIQQGLDSLLEGRTALVIAHRLSTVRHLDRIVVLEGGRVVQDGTHEELLAQEGGLYRRLWQLQAGPDPEA